MPHLRKRHSGIVIQKALSFSPIVGVMGHRQVGKTTLLESACRSYQSMDRMASFQQASADPERFLRGFTQFPVGLDESQLVPPLFPALKEHVRVNKQPGQFLLSGSVRFASRKEIRESLTGRILLTDLFPFTAAETVGLPLARFLIRVMQSSSPRALSQMVLSPAVTPSNARGLRKAFNNSLDCGGLPGVCFARDRKMRRLKWESQLETILTRDIELVSQTNLSYTVKKQVLAELARSQGIALDYRALSRKVRVSVPALRKLLLAFEALFLIRVLPCEGGEKAPVIFLEDQGEAQHLADFRLDDLSRFINTVYMHVRVPFLLPLMHLDSPGRSFQYRTRGGALVPFAFQSGKNSIGIIPSLEEAPSRAILGSAKSYLDWDAGGKVAIIHPFHKKTVLGERLVLLPLELALS